MKQAKSCRDNLAKIIYSQLFDWLIQNINRALSKHNGMSVEMEFENVLFCSNKLEITLINPSKFAFNWNSGYLWF